MILPVTMSQNLSVSKAEISTDLEIKEERKGEIDHRAIFDIENGKIRIYSVFYREPGYPDEEIAERF